MPENKKEKEKDKELLRYQENIKMVSDLAFKQLEQENSNPIFYFD